jgi:hypothetical protein
MGSALEKTAHKLPKKARRMQHKAAKAMRPERRAKGLMLFGATLGLAEIFATRRLTRSLDVRGSETFVRAMGLRELASSAAIVANRTIGTWTRVAGDALDVAALASAFPGNKRKRNLGLALGAVLGAAALDFATARALSRRPALA